MLFEGVDVHYTCRLVIYKLNNKLYSKYTKFNDMNKHFIRVVKSPILHEGKIRSDEITVLTTSLKSKLDDRFIELVCFELDKVAEMIDTKQKSIEEQPKLLKKIRQ